MLTHGNRRNCAAPVHDYEGTEDMKYFTRIVDSMIKLMVPLVIITC